MITFKQIEALYWIVQLGSFEAAAAKLHMSQSAISKRIQELEETFNTEIFDRTRRNARLTEKGSELLDYAKDLLERRDYLLERVSSKEVLVRHFRLGVTEPSIRNAVTKSDAQALLLSFLWWFPSGSPSSLPYQVTVRSFNSP